MKLFNIYLVLLISFSLMSCLTDTNQIVELDHDKIEMDGTRGVNVYEFKGEMVFAKPLKVKFEKAEQQNDEAVTSIMRALVGAENKAQLLDVNFTMSDEPVSDMFVFGIETEDEKELTFEMYDEEGFEMAANNTISVTQGNNYRALNVKSLEEGNYFFKTNVGDITSTRLETNAPNSLAATQEGSPMTSLGYTLKPKGDVVEATIWAEFDDAGQEPILGIAGEMLLKSLQKYAEYLDSGGDPDQFSKK